MAEKGRERGKRRSFFVLPMSLSSKTALLTKRKRGKRRSLLVLPVGLSTKTALLKKRKKQMKANK